MEYYLVEPRFDRDVIIGASNVPAKIWPVLAEITTHTDQYSEHGATQKRRN